MRFNILLLPALALSILFASCDNGTATSGTESGSEKSKPANARFELLPASSTGITFSNTITEDYRNNILVNSYLYNGGGVAIIDVNNDGLQDLYFTATQEPNRLYLNKGDFTFEDITGSAGVEAASGFKTGVTVVDINADGFQDLYVCRSGMRADASRTNLLYINNGDLTFTEKSGEYGLNDVSASNHANFFDYDLDGDLDVYVLNHPVDFAKVNSVSVHPDGDDFVRNTEPLNQWDSDKLFRNDNGKFVNVSQQAGIHNRAWGLSVTVTDFNNDRYPDLLVGNDYIEPDLVYINNKNGTFSIQTDRYFRHMSNHTMGVDIADINNDGLVDVVALDMIAEDNQRQKELMTTMVLDRYNNLVRFHYGHQMMRNVLQLNTGRSPEEGDVFSEIGVLSGISNTDWSWSPLLVDFDNDGRKDLYVTNGYRRDISNLDYLVYTSPKEAPGGRLNQSKFPSIEDYLKLIPSQPLRNYMFRNQDGLQFEQVNNEWGLTEESYSNGSAYADLDNDGDMDLLVNNVFGDVMVYRNKTSDMGDSHNWIQIELEGPEKNKKGIGAKVRLTANGEKQYQEMTPTRGFLSSSQLMLHFGLGDAALVDKLEIMWPDGKTQALDNQPANQKLTLRYSDAAKGNWTTDQHEPVFARADKGIDFRHVENEFEDFNRERLLPHRFSNLGPAIATGDVNGDGLEDFFVGGAVNQAGMVYVQQQNASFKPAASFQEDAVYEDMGAAFFDADGDGDQDLYVASGGSSYEANSANYQDRLYMNDGKGGFTRSQGVIPNNITSSSCVEPYDFDGDGDMDVLIGGLVTPGRYPTAPATCFLVNEGGRFTDMCAQLAPELQQLGMINDLEWADLNGDGQAELIATGEWLPITVFKLDNGKLKNVTSEYGLEHSSGWWNCVSAADIDGDGDLDLIGGNLGLNSRLKASKDEPLRLFVDDFDRNGSLDPVLAYYNDGKLYPLPQRDMMIKQMPSLKKKFVYYRDYGKATMEDVFSKSELEQASQFEAKTFATAWYENRDGKMIAHELPVEVQFAPVTEILAEDINGDGAVDLLMVGNSYSPDVETGRYDAGNGVLLLNDGKGNFEWVPNRESGFWATREARDMAKITLADGSQLYLVANNNDKLETYVLKARLEQ